jgi:protein-disulfide isomerase
MLKTLDLPGDVAIVEFVDFECPVCACHASVTLPRTREELIDKGLARYMALKTIGRMNGR